MEMDTYDPKNPYFVQDVDTLCAVCTKILSADNICSLTSTVSMSSFTKAYEVLQEICEFTFHMDGPQSLCLTCFKNTQFVYEFKELCRTSYSYFVKYSQHQEQLSDKANIVIEDTVIQYEMDDYRVDSATAQHQEQPADKATMVTEDIVVKLEIDNFKDDSSTAQHFSSDSTESQDSVTTMKPVISSARNICNKAEELFNNITQYQEMMSEDTQVAIDIAEVELNEVQIEENANITEYPLDYLKPLKKSDKPFPCRYCSTLFLSTSARVTHENVHKRCYVCSYCDQACGSKTLLDIHERKHTTDKPYPCSYCSKSFLTTSNKATHENLHKRCYVCTYCDQACGSKSQLDMHQRKHTGERPYSCEYCAWAFKSKDHLQKHRSIHEKQRPWICEICSRAFRLRKALRSHLKSHTRQPHACTECSFVTKNGNTFKCHLKTHKEKC